MSSGMRSQLIGDQAQEAVRSALTRAKIFCGGFEKDRGEDLIVELEGYVPPSEARPEPRIGLLQIKGLEESPESLSDEAYTSRKLSIRKLQRWAAYPLPVFVVAVDLVGEQSRFFGQSVDGLISEQTPDDLAVLNQASLTLKVPSAEDLPAFLSAEIEGFYKKCAFDLSNLDAAQVARNHYEILSVADSTVPLTAQVRMKHVRVLWKGPWRPAHFWATLNHLADFRLRPLGGRAKPLLATIHVYRSLMDERDNNAVAHMSWVEESHPDADTVRSAMNWERAKHWSRFRFNVPPNLTTLPESYVESVSDEVFLRHTNGLWTSLDRLSERILTSLDATFRVDDAALRSLQSEFQALDDEWNSKPGRPSPQYRALDKMLGEYLTAADSALLWLRGNDKTGETTRRRYLKQDLDVLRGCSGAYSVLVKILGD